MAAAAVDVAAAAVLPRFSSRSLRSSILSRALAVREDTSLSLLFLSGSKFSTEILVLLILFSLEGTIPQDNFTPSLLLFVLHHQQVCLPAALCFTTSTSVHFGSVLFCSAVLFKQLSATSTLYYFFFFFRWLQIFVLLSVWQTTGATFATSSSSSPSVYHHLLFCSVFLLLVWQLFFLHTLVLINCRAINRHWWLTLHRRHDNTSTWLIDCTTTLFRYSFCLIFCYFPSTHLIA